MTLQGQDYNRDFSAQDLNDICAKISAQKNRIARFITQVRVFEKNRARGNLTGDPCKPLSKHCSRVSANRIKTKKSEINGTRQNSLECPGKQSWVF